MKAKMILAACLLGLSVPAMAEFIDSPDKKTVVEEHLKAVSVHQAKMMADGRHVVLEGHLTGRAGTLNAEEFIFTDGKDSIKVEIDGNIWRGRDVSKETRIRLWGEVDRNRFNNSIEIEVDDFEILP
ncbi:Uncharacterized conserved protein [Kingella potus]|uniref:Uncharacterized conserved protein n=1 Tax=Kingella potus TaxID=265175 RepID=A0A377R1W1_9NEIS|nr:NirD/YgiW/YdeI family stress tolerance protein [Kingella potus]UOP00449.1 NirD/YgiW/YdeI family stress tolerance protein [Kingella potus]STR02486.1 Uncharacterized conserved protein [Kingella potus]